MVEYFTRDSLPYILDDGIETTLVALSVNNLFNQEWILECKASRHFSSDSNMFSTVEQNSSQEIVNLASSQDHVIMGKESIQCSMPNIEIRQSRMFVMCLNSTKIYFS